VIVLNGEQRPLDAPVTVAVLLEAIGCGTRGVAVALNGEVVPRAEWGARLVRAGDRVEVLRAAQGG